MRKWLIGLGVVLVIVLVLCFLVVFDVYNQSESIYVAVATPDDVTIVPFDCPPTKVEIINRKDFPLDLGGWKVGYYGGDLHRIPNKTIVAPDDSIIVSGGVRKDGSGVIWVEPPWDSPWPWGLNRAYSFGNCSSLPY